MNMSPFKTKHFQRKTRRAVCGALTFAAVLQFCAPAQAAPCARELSPEVVSRMWMDGDNQVAAVYVNGRELVAFRSRQGAVCAADQAEDLAVRLQEMVNDRKFDVNQLLPSRDGDRIAIKFEGTTVFSFEGGSPSDVDAFLESGVKIVNALRAAYGEPLLPLSSNGLSPTDLANTGSSRFSGHASWYGKQFHGRRCSDGSRFDMNGLSAAHKTLPFGTKLLVVNRRTGNSVVVEVKDRGPFIAGRVLDLSKGAAYKLNMLGAGVAMVDCVVLSNK
jgi:rare lipoprotein A